MSAYCILLFLRSPMSEQETHREMQRCFGWSTERHRVLVRLLLNNLVRAGLLRTRAGRPHEQYQCTQAGNLLLNTIGVPRELEHWIG